MSEKSSEPPIHLQAVLRRSERLRGWRKLNPNTLSEERRLEIIWDAFVHDRVIAVAIDVLSKALVATPSSFAFLCTTAGPSVEASELPLHSHSCIVREQVYKGVPQICTGSEISGKVDDVIVAHEAFPVEHFEKHAPIKI